MAVSHMHLWELLNMLEGRVPHLNLFLVIKDGVAVYSWKIVVSIIAF